MTVFSDKLDRVFETLALGFEADTAALAAAVARGLSKIGVAVGSGGSAVAAEFLATCRETLQARPTLVQTPLSFVLGAGDLADEQVWLFSARGENADILAALKAAVARGAGAIHIVTSNPGGTLATSARTMPQAHVHLPPAADPKDGFLATHSLMAAVAALLQAADKCARRPAGPELREAFLEGARTRLTRERRAEIARGFAAFKPSDTLLLLVDPRLGPVSALIETSVWETSLCAVQRTDFRNFAHGRHVWLARKTENTFILSLIGSDTRDAWSEIAGVIPASVRRTEIDHADCGRFRNALGILDGLGVVEALGNNCGIDPGKPGVGAFAREVYEGRALERLSARLTPPMRQKRSAISSRGHPDAPSLDLANAEAKVRGRFAEARFQGLVLDYDGTLVATDARFDPPNPDIVDELRRLLDGGLRMAIATGRGGSAGEALRGLFPEEHHPRILMGYYNGAYVRPLGIDIRERPPVQGEGIAEALAWLDGRRDLFRAYDVKAGPLQATVNLADVLDPDAFEALFEEFRALAGAPLKLARSQHSFDICGADACKTAVVSALAEDLGDVDAPILCIGDSGAWRGNDHVLLGLPYGLSVHEVCDRADLCWSFFGPEVVGPEALLRILRAMRADDDGRFRLHVDALEGVLQPANGGDKGQDAGGRS